MGKPSTPKPSSPPSQPTHSKPPFSKTYSPPQRISSTKYEHPSTARGSTTPQSPQSQSPIPNHPFSTSNCPTDSVISRICRDSDRSIPDRRVCGLLGHSGLRASFQAVVHPITTFYSTILVDHVMWVLPICRKRS